MCSYFLDVTAVKMLCVVHAELLEDKDQQTHINFSLLKSC